MEFGTRYATIEEIVYLLESRLGIVMREHDDSETGVSFHWASDLGARNGIQYYGIDIRPTRHFDVEDQREYLGNENWTGFTFVIGVSDELLSEGAQIRALIANGELLANEIRP